MSLEEMEAWLDCLTLAAQENSISLFDSSIVQKPFSFVEFKFYFLPRRFVPCLSYWPRVMLPVW